MSSPFPLACRFLGFLFLMSLGLMLGCSGDKTGQETKTALDSTSAAEASGPSREEQLSSGKSLFASQCAFCHGDKGYGDGPAAKYLYPRPHNFSIGKFRLVSAVNRVPTDQDLLRVITHGMPGSAMLPFGHLSETERMALVAYVRELTRQGVEERHKQRSAQIGEEVDATQLTELFEQTVKAGPALSIPEDLPAPSPESIARGRTHYRLCAGCHGVNGKGDGNFDQRDDNGIPTRPRDFTRGIFKGGRDTASLFARIRLGLPGTPMPSSPDLKAADIGDLVNFIQSLSDPKMQDRYEHKRKEIVARKAKGSLTGPVNEAEWQTAASVPIVVSPLWWRNEPEADLQVAALHDGQTLAIRLSWLDDTANLKDNPPATKDMAALQLYKGTPEPVLGMSPTDKPMDCWLWSANLQAANPNKVYPHLSLALPGTPKPASLRELRQEFPPSLTEKDVQEKGIKGSGRMQISTVVNSLGNWENGRWTVVFKRALDAKSEGISLSGGEKVSIAFALWNGAAADKSAQKQISIWHDLKLE